jgi:membrane-bound lytic murein transglycosylase B
MNYGSKLISKILLISVIPIGFILLFSSKLSLSSFERVNIDSKIEFFKPLIEKYAIAGGDTNFILSLIKDLHTEFNEKYVRINISGYLKKSDYSHYSNVRSVNNTRDFLEKYRIDFDSCETKYPVPREIIAAIIWIETRNGTYLGKNNIASVFLSTALADSPEFIEMNKNYARKLYSSSQKDLQAVEAEIIQRAHKKADWALGELLALEKIYLSTNISVFDLKGSFAGAFGMPQFLPSSFIKWAVDGDNDGMVDLYNPVDAIYSIANYLRTNGWDTTSTGQRAAIFHYNNNNSYVDAVLNLASKAK